MQLFFLPYSIQRSNFNKRETESLKNQKRQTLETILKNSWQWRLAKVDAWQQFNTVPPTRERNVACAHLAARLCVSAM